MNRAPESIAVPFWRQPFFGSAKDEATIGSAIEWDSLRLEVEEVEDGRATRVLVTRITGGV